VQDLISEWNSLRLVLLRHGVAPIVLGTLSCVGFLTEDARALLWTDDLDFGFLDEDQGTDSEICNALRDCGYRQVQPGKWQKRRGPVLEIDLIGQGAPGGGSPALRHEWWLSWMKYHLVEYALPAGYELPAAALGSMTAPSAGAALLGKSLKLAGYIARADWPHNRRDVEHATKAALDATVILADVGYTRLRSIFAGAALAILSDEPPEAELSYVRARRAFAELFGLASGVAYAIAAPLASRMGLDVGQASAVGCALAQDA